MTNMNLALPITGVILAGGRATRMGGQDKGLIVLEGKPLITYVIARFKSQVQSLFISANRHQQIYAQLGQCPVLSDSIGHYDGPLAGMATTLSQAATDYVVFVPCDCPLFSSQLVRRLYDALIAAKADISVAHDGARPHPVIALLKRSLYLDLCHFLHHTPERKIRRWYQRHRLIEVDYSDMPDSLININTPSDLVRVADILRAHPLLG